MSCRYTIFRKFLLLGLLAVILPTLGCGSSFLQSRRIAKPFSPESAATCDTLRQQLLQLRQDLRKQTELVQKPAQKRLAVLTSLSLQEHNKNTKPLSTPREKMDLLISSDLLVNENEIWRFVEKVNNLDILGILCRDLEETVAPGIGDGLFYADFRRVGEEYIAYLLFRDDKLVMVFAPNNDTIDEYDRETILSLIGHASKAAVNEGAKAAIP